MKALALPLLLLAAPAIAASFQETSLLDRAVAGFTGHGVGEEGGARAPVDTRLRLASCPMVALSWYGTRHEAVLVSCPEPAWRIYVPVKLGTAPVAEPSAAPVAAPAAVAAPVIKRGDPVTVAAGNSGFSITREGVAMGDAAPGARFFVRVEDNKPPIQAVALAAGQATLPGWGE